jgi:hypothetical protein
MEDLMAHFGNWLFFNSLPFYENTVIEVGHSGDNHKQESKDIRPFKNACEVD